MTPEDTLLAFLRGSLGAKRDRVLDLASRPTAHAKFLALLHHELGDLFDKTCVVAALPDAAWSQSAVRFRPPREFGLVVPSLQQAYDQPVQPELVVTADARYAYWRDEMLADLQRLIIAHVPTPARLNR